MPIIKVPGHGNVRFPDDMTDEQISHAIQQNNPELSPQSSQENQGYFQKLGQDFAAGPSAISNAGDNILNGILGFGDAARNAIASSLNIIPGVNISKVKTGDGTAYHVGHVAGEIGTFLGGGEILDALRVAGKLGTFAKRLEGTPLKESLKRVLGSACLS